MNFDDIMNADYPLPDPSWDYAQIYNQCQKACSELKFLLELMSKIEDATPESDAQIKQHLDEVGQQLNSARRMVDS
jgi:hypothetical protein